MIKITGITHSAGMHSDQIPIKDRPSTYLNSSLPPKAQTSLSPPPDESVPPLVLTQPTIFGQQSIKGNIEELRKKYGVLK